MRSPHFCLRRNRGHEEGSAIIAVVSVLALLTQLLIALLQSVRIERSSSAACAAEEQAHLSAESGYASACELLLITTSNRPARRDIEVLHVVLFWQIIENMSKSTETLCQLFDRLGVCVLCEL